jgi:hypothetical protein
MDAIEADWKERHSPKASDWEKAKWELRSKLEEHLPELLIEHTRPIDARTKFTYSYKQVGSFDGDFPRLFQLTPSAETKLEIHEFEVEGKRVKLATNAAEWDRLQLPLVKKKLADKLKDDARRAGKESSSEARELTPAQRKEKEKEKAKQLANRIATWRHGWLKTLVARELPYHNLISARVVLWLCTNPLGVFELSDRARVKQSIEKAAKELGGRGGDPWSAIGSVIDPAQPIAGLQQCDTIAQAIARGVILAEDGATFPVVSWDKLDDLATIASIDLAHEWKLLQDKHASEQARATFVSFFELHQNAQLDALGAELGVKHVAETSGKAAKVKLLTAGLARRYPLPKAIKPVVSAKGKRGAK